MRKKLFAILMSAMMMVTFMPAMAFAAVEDDDRFVEVTNTPVQHEWEFDKVLVAPTCDSNGIIQVKCDCGQTKMISSWREAKELGLEAKLEKIKDHKGKTTTSKMTPAETEAALVGEIDSRLAQLVAVLQDAQLKAYVDAGKTVTEEGREYWENRIESAKNEVGEKELAVGQAQGTYDKAVAALEGYDKTILQSKEASTGKKHRDTVREGYVKAIWDAKRDLNQKTKELTKAQNKLNETIAKSKTVSEAALDAVVSFADDVAKLLVGVAPAYAKTEALVADITSVISRALSNEIISDKTKTGIAYGRHGFLDAAMATVRIVINDYMTNLFGNVVEVAAAPLVVNADSACYYLVTECSECGVLEIRAVEHEGTPAFACSTNYECTECHKAIHTSNTNEFENDVITILEQAATLVKDLNDEDADDDKFLRAEESTNGRGGHHWNLATDVEQDAFVLANMLFSVHTDTAHKLKAEVIAKACGNIIKVSCETCGESVSFTVPTAFKHTSEWVTLKEADCSTGETGLKVKKCTECEAIDPLTFTVLYPKHNFVEKKVERTCTLPGYTTTACEVCGQENALITAKNWEAPLGHKYNDVETVVEPTCESEGLLKISCQNCDQVEYLTVDDLENYAYIVDLKEFNEVMNVIKNDKDSAEQKLWNLIWKYSDYTKRGNLKDDAADFFVLGVADYLHDQDTKRWKETINYYFFGFGNVAGFPDLLTNPVKLPSIEKKNHNFTTWAVLSEPDCENGTIWSRKCKTCGYIDEHYDGRIDAGDKLGHTPETVEVAATCGKAAYTYTYCTTCHKYLQADETYAEARYENPVKGSKPVVAKDVKCTPADEWTTLVEATFTTAGTRVKKCQKCGAYCDSDDIAVKKLAKAYQPTLKAGKKQFQVNFKNASKAATGYQIAYKVTGANNYKYVKTTFKSKKTIKNLKKGKKYTVKVRAYVEENGKTVYGKWCAVKYVKVK